MRIAFIRKHGKDRLFMHELSAKTIHHADGTSAIRVEQRRKLIHYRQVFINQQPLIYNIDLYTAQVKTLPIKLDIFRRADHSVIPSRFEIVAEKLKLLHGRQIFKVDDRNKRFAISFAAAEFIPAA